MIGKVQFLVRETGNLFAISLEGVRPTWDVRNWWPEYLRQCWFIAKITCLPVVLIAIPFGVVIALHVGTFNRQVGAASATGAAMVLAIVREASPVATALLIAFEMVTTPTIDEVFVGDIADDQATASCATTGVVETSQGTNDETGFYAEVQLARIDGRWLVTNVLNLNFALGGGAADPGGTSTTTTAAPGP